MVGEDPISSINYSILIVDDHAVCRDGVEWVIRGHIDTPLVIEHASDGATAIARIKAKIPDLIILDINLPHLSGLEVIRQLKMSEYRPRTIVLTQCEDPDTLDALVQLGVDGILFKNHDSAKLKEALDTVIRGSRYIEQCKAFLSTKNKESSRGNLTKRECEVIELVARGLTNKEIGVALSCSEETVKSHKTNGMKKLKAKNSPELVAKFYGLSFLNGPKVS